MKKISVWAGRCPYCRDEDQGVHGRFLIVLMIIVAGVLFAHFYMKHYGNPLSVPPAELIDKLKDVGAIK